MISEYDNEGDSPAYLRHTRRVRPHRDLVSDHHVPNLVMHGEHCRLELA